MAGIGFELRKVLKPDRLLSIAKVYSYSALLSSGPWVISIIAIIVVGFINIATMGGDGDSAVKYQIVITYAIALASSMIITGFIQLPFTRFIADLIFAKREEEVLPAYYGALVMTWFVGFPFILPIMFIVFKDQSTFFIISVMSTFLTLSGVWVSNILAASLKYYHGVLMAYAIAYGMIILLSLLYGETLEILITIFFIGNAILLVVLMTLITKSYHSTKLISFEFFQRKTFYWTLGFAGLFYNLGAWVDKFIFWYHPLTGYAVIGELHASVVYDMPIFIAYLSILPGMAIFFFRLEADFAEKYDLFFDAVRSGGTLDVIKQYRNEMVDIIRHSIREVIVIQGIVNIILFLSAPALFKLLNIPQLYLGLFHILTVGAQLQLGFMSVMALLYYLDRRTLAMRLAFAFFALNGILTFISIYLGPAMFGYGYAVSLLIVFTASILVVRREMRELDYETFMLR
ncbi:MAG: exopolysaccharide Pel transporter PelG [Campylobacterota bacterium]|nr:exopolysaccharide Pel transporter PelG [Campylobacterota bacterium]